MQEQVTFMSQLEVYQSAQTTIEKLLRVRVSNSQLHRITNYYGCALEEDMQKTPPKIAIEEGEVVYAQMDGSMVLTDDGWQEVKVGRVFSSGAIEKQSIGSRRNVIKTSQYTAHLGTHSDFMEKFKKGLAHYECLGKRLVFITDGATWMYNWLRQHYSKAQHILDYYHVVEHIATVGKSLISNRSEFENWLTKLKSLVLNSKHDQIKSELEQLHTTTAQQQAEKQRLLRYLHKNQYRMDYLKYRQAGLQIGSGAIEAAHRTLVQTRMKKSGQRWSDQGAKNMLNLRVAFKSDRWNLVMEKIWKSAA